MKKWFVFLFFLFCFLLVGFVYADTIYISSNYYLLSRESLEINNVSAGANVTFTVENGTLDALGTILTDNSTGSFSVLPSYDGNLTVATAGTVTVYVNGVLYSDTFPFVSGVNLLITWIYAPTPTASPNIFSEDDLVGFAIIAVLVVFVVVACLFLVYQRKNK
jgi:hypothetical protein